MDSSVFNSLIFVTKTFLLTSAIIMCYAGGLLMLSGKEIDRAMEQLARYKKMFPGTKNLSNLQNESQKRKWWNIQCWILFILSVIFCFMFIALVKILESYQY